VIRTVAKIFSTTYVIALQYSFDYCNSPENSEFSKTTKAHNKTYELRSTILFNEEMFLSQAAIPMPKIFF